MMTMNKKLIIGLCLASILTIGTSVFAASSLSMTERTNKQTYSLNVNDKPVSLGDLTIYKEGSTLMVPLRKTAESLGFKVDWKGETISIDNGEVKTTLTMGEDKYYKASSQAIGLSQAIPLGAAPIVINGTTYIPVELFNLLYSNLGTVSFNDSEINLSTMQDISLTKTASLMINNVGYTLSIDLPEYIEKYVELNSLEQTFGNNESYTMILLEFTKENNIANIGNISIYTTQQFEALKAEGGPIPTEVSNENGIVIAFSGLQDMPFELGTEEATLVGKYHSEVSELLKTIKLTKRPLDLSEMEGIPIGQATIRAIHAPIIQSSYLGQTAAWSITIVNDFDIK